MGNGACLHRFAKEFRRVIRSDGGSASQALPLSPKLGIFFKKSGSPAIIIHAEDGHRPRLPLANTPLRLGGTGDSVFGMLPFTDDPAHIALTAEMQIPLSSI